MSCEDCREAPLRGAFYRWGNANVEIVGCREHIRDVMAALNTVQPGPAPPVALEELARQLYELMVARGRAARLIRPDYALTWATEPEALRADWRVAAHLAIRLCRKGKEPLRP